MLEAEKNYWERKRILVEDEHQQSKYEAGPPEEPTLEAKFDVERFEADIEQTLEEYERRQREGKDKAQGTEPSISKMERKNTIAEKLQVIKEYQRRRREAEEKIGTYEAGSSGNQETYDSGPEDDLSDNVDAEKKRIIEAYERR